MKETGEHGCGNDCTRDWGCKLLQRDEDNSARPDDNQSRGIGKAICQSIADAIEKPLVIYASSRKGEDVSIASRSPNTKVKYARLDISSIESIQTLASKIKAEHGHLDILVNNGAFHPGRQTTINGAKKTLEVNYNGTLEVSLAHRRNTRST